jgi:hypothetical protein
MRGANLAEAMASAVDRIVSAREGAGALDKAIEAVDGTIGRFSGKNATSYLEAYRAEMVMRDIPEGRQLSGFPQVATPGILAKVLEVREECGMWEEFEGRLLKKSGHDDALRLLKCEFMEWLETPEKGRSASALVRRAIHTSVDAGPDGAGHKPCPAIRQVGRRKRQGEDRPFA